MRKTALLLGLLAIVSPSMQLLAEPAWLQDWDTRYPQFDAAAKPRP